MRADADQIGMKTLRAALPAGEGACMAVTTITTTEITGEKTATKTAGG